MDRLAALAAEAERARAGTEDYLKAIGPDRLGFRPTPESRSFVEQVLYLAPTKFVIAASAASIWR